MCWAAHTHQNKAPSPSSPLPLKLSHFSRSLQQEKDLLKIQQEREREKDVLKIQQEEEEGWAMELALRVQEMDGEEELGGGGV